MYHTNTNVHIDAFDFELPMFDRHKIKIHRKEEFLKKKHFPHIFFQIYIIVNTGFGHELKSVIRPQNETLE